jgi:hypothetical protein
VIRDESLVVLELLKIRILQCEIWEGFQRTYETSEIYFIWIHLILYYKSEKEKEKAPCTGVANYTDQLEDLCLLEIQKEGFDVLGEVMVLR